VTAVFFGALLVAGLTLLVVTAVRVLGGGIAGPPERTTEHESRGAARRILDERYAAGELSTEEYQHRLDVLEGRN
jgi:putative membrane protein